MGSADRYESRLPLSVSLKNESDIEQVVFETPSGDIAARERIDAGVTEIKFSLTGGDMLEGDEEIGEYVIAAYDSDDEELESVTYSYRPEVVVTDVELVKSGSMDRYLGAEFAIENTGNAPALLREFYLSDVENITDTGIGENPNPFVSVGELELDLVPEDESEQVDSVVPPGETRRYWKQDFATSGGDVAQYENKCGYELPGEFAVKYAKTESRYELNFHVGEPYQNPVLGYEYCDGLEITAFEPIDE